ncbi:MAG: putative lipid II flippase FtsW [Bacillota bacterium]|nr:putative lipid II flippase FtsW [Bacillota bacterium]
MRRKIALPGGDNLKTVDFGFLLITLILVAFGLVMVFSASYYSSISVNGTPFYYLIRDGIWVCAGLIMMFIGMTLDYRNYKKLALPIMLACLAALVLVLVIGATRNGATRWLAVGPITFMPGEWAKLGMVFFLAWFFGEKPVRARSILLGILPAVIVTAGFAFLIIRQPNLSTALTVCGIAVAMMLVAGMDWAYVGAAAGLGVGGFLFIVLFMKDTYWYARITNFTDPFQDMYGEGYQVAQSLLALGSGGLTGVGLGRSVQKSLYLPEPQNDFILAIIGEELGFIGVIVLLIVYCLLIWRGMRIALRAPDQFGMLLASGVVMMVAIQVILNVAVVTASMPATGINLPFISYGGNGLLMFMFSAGVLLNISKQETRIREAESGG